ncbi:MAG: hypothetical protein MK082_06330 [Phycisphaerales bacterium]|nr:hypothetical protein [Phycisphaerales bacterium]
MKALFDSWWFRIPFAYWLLGILLYPPVYDQPGDGFVRQRVWAWAFIGDDWKGTMLVDWGTILWQFCILVTLVTIVRWVVGRIAGRLRSTRSTN